MNRTFSSATIVESIAARSDSYHWSIRLGAMLLIAALTAAAAQVSVPLAFTAVPFTFQPMVVLLGGLALGSKMGPASQLLYLLAGIIGLPVFAASPLLPPGAMRLLGPTGGFLMAYPVAAWLVGTLAERGFDRRYATSVLAMAAGLLVIYGSGALWLASFARNASAAASAAPIGLQAALATGVYPFVLADVVKLFAAAGISPMLWRLVGAHKR
jgi:biotin transport system substrate-specific component